MADTAIEFVGITFRNPILIASCSLTADIAKMKAMEEAGAAGFVTKLITHAIPPDNNYFRGIVSKSGWATYGDKRLNVEEGVAFLKECKRELKGPVIANIMGKGADEDSWGETAKVCEGAGADGLELDLSCPNVEYSKQKLAQFAGFAIGRSPELTLRVTKAVKEAVKIPVIAKLTPEVEDLLPVARAAQEAGADAISGINAMRGFPGVDIDNGGRPLYPGVETQPYSACMGTLLRPIAAKHTALISRFVPLPYSSVGGVMTWRDVVERLMLGAKTVQLCSTVYLNGLSRITNCVKMLEKFMDKNGHDRVADIIGIAQKYVETDAALPFSEAIWDV